MIINKTKAEKQTNELTKEKKIKIRRRKGEMGARARAQRVGWQYFLFLAL